METVYDRWLLSWSGWRTFRELVYHKNATRAITVICAKTMIKSWFTIMLPGLSE